MKVIVAGTGFSSILCIDQLINLGIKPIVLDIGNQVDEKNKNELKRKTLVYQKNLDAFHYIGGLSNVWSGVIERYLDHDLINWPINENELSDYYNKVTKKLYNCEQYSFHNNLSKNFLDYELKFSNQIFGNTIYQSKNLSIKYASIFINGAGNYEKNKILYKDISAFNIKKTINNFIKESKIDYRKEKIIKVSENNNEVLVDTLNNNEKRTTSCNYLFLGCGAISTYIIMKNSISNFDPNIKIKSTKQFVLPVRFTNLNNFYNKYFNNFPIFQINLNDKNNNIIYSQIYNFNPNIINYFFPKIKNFERYYPFFKLFKNFGLSYFVLGSDYSDEFVIDNYNNLKIFRKKFTNLKFLNMCNELFANKLLKNQFYHYKLPVKMKPLSGNYYGSTFPMSEIKKNFFSSDRFGRIGDFKKISITDSSIFPKLSAKPPTYTIMANSLRIINEVSKLNFFN